MLVHVPDGRLGGGHGSRAPRLRRLPDPRKARGKRHGVVFITVTAVCAVLAGARSVAAIAKWRPVR